MKAFGFCSFKTDSHVVQASLELLIPCFHILSTEITGVYLPAY